MEAEAPVRGQELPPNPAQERFWSTCNAKGNLVEMRDECEIAMGELGQFVGVAFFEPEGEEGGAARARRINEQSRQLIDEMNASPVAAEHGRVEDVFAHHRHAVEVAVGLLRSVVDAPEVIAWCAYIEKMGK